MFLFLLWLFTQISITSVPGTYKHHLLSVFMRSTVVYMERTWRFSWWRSASTLSLNAPLSCISIIFSTVLTKITKHTTPKSHAFPRLLESPAKIGNFSRARCHQQISLLPGGQLWVSWEVYTWNCITFWGQVCYLVTLILLYSIHPAAWIGSSAREKKDVELNMPCSWCH